MVVLLAVVAILAVVLITLGRGDAPLPAGASEQARSESEVAAGERSTSLEVGALSDPGSERVEHALVDHRPTRVRGRVIWPDGVAAYGAAVSHDHTGLSIEDPTPFSGARTEMDGSFELLVPPGVQALIASSGDARSASLHLDASLGRDLEVTLMLLRLPRLRGIVADSYGRPVNGQVRVISRETTSHEGGLTHRRERREFVGVSHDGDFRRDLPLESHLTIRAWADGHAPSQSVEIAPGETADDLRLVAPALVDLQLRVVDAKGAARDGLAVGYHDPQFEQQSDTGIVWSARTDPSGWTVLADVPAEPGRELLIRQQGKSKFKPRVVVDTRIPRATLVLADDALEPAVVEVALIDAGGGLPLAGTLIVEAVGGTDRRTESFGGSKREISIGELTPGTRYGFKLMTWQAPRPELLHEFRAGRSRETRAEPSTPAVPIAYVECEVSRGVQRLELPLEALSRLRVEVRGGDGRPRAGAKVSIEGPVTYRIGNAQSDASGRVIFTGLLSGEHRVTALDRHVLIERRSVSLEPGADQTVILQAGR